METGVTSLIYSLVVVCDAPYVRKWDVKLLDFVGVKITLPFSSSTSGSPPDPAGVLTLNSVDEGCKNALVAGSWSSWFLIYFSFLIQNLMLFASGSIEIDPATLAMYLGSGYCTLAI
ncbi:hypothetical protein OGATHE_001117 [Ogataea polymorpha]|uniref:Uncharacterized protein n=1 Tax=Ogataea polymorpha TaxID=460523 RepID=A0A9P8PQU7_9ASCO|nr:hypothetical protein OGATHE_001117 [Ogataea polymorpha]